MLKNYFKVAIRNLNKNRVFAIINILGLSLGLTISLIVFMFVKHELSYDKHNDGSERIYRMGIVANMMGQSMNAPVSPSPASLALRTEFDGVESATRMNVIKQEIYLRHEETGFYLPAGARVDSAFFKVFTYKFIYGDPISALKEENAIVITEKTAKLFFNDENPMGKILNYDNRQDYIVRGVVEEPKGNSHFHLDFFLAENQIQNIWINNNYQSYVKLEKGTDYDVFFAEMEANFLEKIKPDVEKYLGVPIEDFLKNNTFNYELQALEDIHLYSHKDWEIEQNGNVIYIYVFIGIALLVLIIAGINFMNLSTARSAKRAKEVGVRKVSGASRKMLITQFLTESVIQSFIALFIAFILLELFIPGFNNVMGINLNLFNDHFSQTILFGFALTILYGLFAGSYPALFLSSFKPITILKGDFSKTKSGSLFRKSLVVIQFTSSVVLIIGMIIIFKQINFMHTKDLGFKSDQIIVVPIQTDDMATNFESYKSIFLNDPNVIDLARTSYIPGDQPNQTMYEIVGMKDQLPLWNLNVDDDFIRTMGMEIIEGRNFNDALQSDSVRYFVLNETAVKNFNIEDPVGRQLLAFTGREGGREPGTIIGVVKDFHIEGFNSQIKPMIMMNDNFLWWVTFKINPENLNETIAGIESKWNELEPSHPFRYTFMDERFGEHFKQQESFATIFLYLTMLAIFIAILGLYGLASYTTEQRTKEIGIRKVMGASVSQLMKMLTMEFVKLVLLANLIAWPITMLLAKNWLSRFSYQIDMPFTPYIFATVIALLIAVLTVSSQAYQASISDPVKALKYE